MQVIWVSTQGNDSTANGSRSAPYKTIEAARLVFSSGDQIRLEPGAYTISDTLFFSGVNGSIMAEDPGESSIQPVVTALYSSVINVRDCERFVVQGISFLQATNAVTNSIGIEARRVAYLVIDACTISDFTVTGDAYAIYTEDSFGKINGCTVENIMASGTVYGILSGRMDVTNNTISTLTAAIAAYAVRAGSLAVPPAPPPS